jgi:aspartyl-tRNA(Asn)/glutamyl-tRNA(Gln) amidotransferase subunit A
MTTIDTALLPDVPPSIMHAAAALRSGELTSVQLVEACLARADVLDPILGVFIQRLDETALAAAAIADDELAAGIDRGPLHGIPLGIKDIIATKESTTTAQSLILDPAWGSTGDAVVVSRLRAAGAIVIGKTSTMEFAIGMPDPSKPFPVPRNPWDTTRWTGGSSSGTGAGVAAGLFMGGLGTDTGGSVRIPAAFCGISGLKQTFGLVPKSGCVPLGFSLDHIGPMAPSAADCLAMIAVMAGPDPSDPNCIDLRDPVWPDTLATSLVGLTIGVDRVNHLTVDGVEPAAVAAFEAALRVLAAAGAEVIEVEIPHYELMRAAGTVTSRGEASSYHRTDLSQRWSEYGVHTSKATSMGTLVSGADYVQAQRVRAFCNAALAEMMAPLDAIVTPMAGIGAPLLEGLDHRSFMEWPVFSQFWNPTGLPALAIPMGRTPDGLPLSMQIAGKAQAEATVLTVAHAYQAATDWHLAKPAFDASLLVARS